MLLKISLKYYSEPLQLGFNTWQQVYDVKKEIWLKAEYHAGRLVYGKQRIPYKKITANITNRNFIVQQYCPF